MKGLKTFIEKVQMDYNDNNGFDGCYYFRLKEDLYLVFASGDQEEDEGLLGKIARNSDDLQCDYDWDWEAAEDYEWEDSHCEESSSLRIEKEVSKLVEPKWLTSYKDFVLEEYEEISEDNEGDTLNILFSTFDTEDWGCLDIEVKYNPRKEEYCVSVNGRRGVSIDFTVETTLEGFQEDMETAGWQTLYEYFVGEARSRIED